MAVTDACRLAAMDAIADKGSLMIADGGPSTMTDGVLFAAVDIAEVKREPESCAAPNSDGDITGGEPVLKSEMSADEEKTTTRDDVTAKTVASGRLPRKRGRPRKHPEASSASKSGNERSPRSKRSVAAEGGTMADTMTEDGPSAVIDDGDGTPPEPEDKPGSSYAKGRASKTELCAPYVVVHGGATVYKCPTCGWETQYVGYFSRHLKSAYGALKPWMGFNFIFRIQCIESACIS